MLGSASVDKHSALVPVIPRWFRADLMPGCLLSTGSTLYSFSCVIIVLVSVNNLVISGVWRQHEPRWAQVWWFFFCYYCVKIGLNV